MLPHRGGLSLKHPLHRFAKQLDDKLEALNRAIDDQTACVGLGKSFFQAIKGAAEVFQTL